MPPVPHRVTIGYLRKRLWLAKMLIGASLLVAVAIGWAVLANFGTHVAYERLFTDLIEKINLFNSERVISSPNQAEHNKILQAQLRDITEIIAFIRQHDNKHQSELESQMSFIEIDMRVAPQTLSDRYPVSRETMPEHIYKLWHDSEHQGQTFEDILTRFLILGYRVANSNDQSAADYNVSVNALQTLMNKELLPAFSTVTNALAEYTSGRVYTGLNLLLLCATLGIAATIVTGQFIIKPPLYSVLASQDAVTLERDRALNSERAKREFLGMMSHELRTPLNGILGFTNLLLGTPLNVTQKDYAETIRSAGITLLDLLNDILDIETGSIELEKSAFSLESVTSEVLNLLGPQAFAKRLDLGAYVDTNLPDKLAGDAGRIRQVLLKIVGNAIKFTERGGIAIEVKRGQDRDDGKINVVISVNDTGIGIPRHQLGEIFEHFTQVDTSSSRLHGGAGLGLPICKRLVTLMKGEIGVESVPDKGSTFWFSLPIEQADPPSKNILTASNTNFTGKRILVVDDNAINRQLFRLQLEGFKAEVECVEDGRAALTALSEFEQRGKYFDVAIIDHMMPLMDGVALRRLIREQAQYDALKLIISSSGGIAFDQQARALGFDAACPKPVIQENLIRNIQTLLDQPTRQRYNGLGSMASIEPQNGAEEAPRQARLLVAEDNHINQRLIITALTEAGYTVDAVADGVEAVHAMQRLPYDLILMDIRMPVMSGVDATRRIRAMPQPAGNVPIIAMTANTLPGDREEYLAAGMNEYVPKPIDFQDLLTKICAYLDGTAPELVRPEGEHKRSRRHQAANS